MLLAATRKNIKCIKCIKMLNLLNVFKILKFYNSITQHISESTTNLTSEGYVNNANSLG